MDLVSVDKKKFCKMAVLIYREIRQGIMTPNIFSMIRLGLLTCTQYSQEIEMLHSGGISVLVVESLKDVIRQLKKEEAITKSEYSQLVSEYNLLKKEMLLMAVNEILIMIKTLE